MPADPHRWTDAVQEALVRYLGDARFVAELHRCLLPSTHVQAHALDRTFTVQDAEPADQGIVFEVTDDQFGFAARFIVNLRQIPGEPPHSA